MKTSITFKTFVCFLLLLFVSNISYSQENKLTAEVHNLFLDNQSETKIIQIRFLNCSKEEFEQLNIKSSLSSSLTMFRKAYSSEYSIASFHYSKASDITTDDIKALLMQINVTNVVFNEKKVKVSELENYHFSPIEKANNSEKLEK